MKKRGIWLTAIAATVIVLIGGTTSWFLRHGEHKPQCQFSAILRQEVGNQHLYCLAPGLLPIGVASHEADATFGQGAVVFAIQDGQTTLAVSEQRKPSAAAVTKFVTNIIPLHFDVPTPIGTAQTGIAQNRSITSLAATSNVWVIITAPQSYNTSRLAQIVKAFEAD